MNSKISKYILGFFAIFFILALSIKPLSIYMIEIYLSDLLKTEVQIVSFDLNSIELTASIKSKSNIATLKVIKIYPLEANLTYNGNADAFSIYHPVHAKSYLDAKIYYDEFLKIEGTLSAYKSKSKFLVQEEIKDWSVSANILDLNLTQFQKENNLPEIASGNINADIYFHTTNDSHIKAFSKLLKIKNTNLNDFKINITDIQQNILAKASFKSKTINYKSIWLKYNKTTNKFKSKLELNYKNNEININLSGENKKISVLANADINIDNSTIQMLNFKYDLNTNNLETDLNLHLKKLQKYKILNKLLKVDLYENLDALAKIKIENSNIFVNVETKSFGGLVDVSYLNEVLMYKAKKVNLKKVFTLFGVSENINSTFDLDGSYKKDNIKINASTKLLEIDEVKIKNINLNTFGNIDNLKSKISLKTEYADIKEAKINIENLKDINITANIKTKYLKDNLHLNSKFVYKKEFSRIYLKLFSDEIELLVSDASYKNNILKANYSSIIKPNLSTLKTNLHINGNILYNKNINISANSKDFGGMVSLKYLDDKIKVKAKDISLHKLLVQTNQNYYASGEFDLDADGSFKNLDFIFRSSNLNLDKNELGIDENITALIKGSVNEHKLSLHSFIYNRYIDAKKGRLDYSFKEKKMQLSFPLSIKQKGNKLDIVLDANVALLDEIKADVLIKQKNDKLYIKDITIKDKDIKATIFLDIGELNVYKNFIDYSLYGKLHVNGKYEKDIESSNLFLKTDSFGGSTKIKLIDDNLYVTMKNITVYKLGILLKHDSLSTDGSLYADSKYNFKKENGYLNVSAKDVKLKGVNIDQSLQELQDILGLNLYAMGKSIYNKRKPNFEEKQLSTHINEFEFDVDITPKIIISKDIAMSTDISRFAVNMKLKRNGDIKEFELAILDKQACAIIKQNLNGNIKNPKLINTKGATVIVLGTAPKEILKTGGKIVDAGASFIDSTASYILKKALKREKQVTFLNDTLTKGENVFSIGKDMIVSGTCKAFYNGQVKHPSEK